MNTANHDAEEGSEHRQQQAKANAYAEPMNQAGKHVTAVTIGSKPMPSTGRKGRRSVFTQVGLQRVMCYRGHNRPNFGAATGTGKALGGIFFAFAHRGKQLAIIGFGLVFAAKVRIAVAHKRRKIRLALVTHQERFVVNRPGTRERQQIRHHKHHQRPKRPLVLAEALQAIQRFLCQPKFHAVNLLNALGRLKQLRD